MRTYLDRLGTPNAINWVSVVVVFAILMAGAVVVNFGSYEGRVLEFIGIRLLVLGVFAGILGLGRLALNRLARERPRPGVTIAAFIIGVVASSLLFDMLLVQAGFATEHRFAMRLISTSLGVLPALVFAALLVGFARDFTHSNEALAAAAQALVETRAQTSSRIEQRKAQLLARIRTQIVDALADMRVGGEAQTAEGMKALIDDVVRPASYRLANHIDPEVVPVTNIPSSRVPWRRVARNALQANPFYPVAGTVFVGLLVGGFAAPALGVKGIIAALATLALAFLSSVVLRAAWKLLPSSVGTTARALLYAMSCAMFAMITGALVAPLSSVTLLNPFVLAVWSFLCLIPSVIVAIFYSARTLMRETQRALSLTIAELEREVVTLNTEHRRMQREVSRVLHGPVQDAINSAIARSQSAENDLSHDALVSELHDRIDRVLSSVSGEASGHHVDVRALFADIAELWDGLVEIVFDVDDAVFDAIAQDARAAYAVAETVREACANAIRHGGAQHVTVGIHALLNERLLMVAVVNDGSPLPEAEVPGIGSQVLSELSLDWQRADRDGQVLLTARIPVAVSASLA